MKTVLVVFLLSSSLLASAATRHAVCEVKPWWVAPDGLRSASLEPIGRFEADGNEGDTTRSFKDPYKVPSPNLVIQTELEFRFDYSKKTPAPYSIRAAIALSDHEPAADATILESPDASMAEVPYTKKWDIRVTKGIFHADRVYLYTLHCYGTR